MRVLVVDDDAGSRVALEALLRDAHFVTLTAADGETALAEACRERPDAILTDLRMPGMDGVELCRRVREVDPAVPVIIMTAHTDLQPVIESLRAGAEDYLVKPLSSDAVLCCMRRALACRKANARHGTARGPLEERQVLGVSREHEHSEAEALQRAQLNALLENLDEGVAVAEQGGRIVLLNRTARSILGFWSNTPTLESLRSVDARDLAGRRLGAEAYPLERTLAGEQFVDYELLWIRPDGVQRRVMFTGTCVKNAHGEVTMAIVVFRDVTELRRFEQQRDEHLALVSHDLRNPLGTLLMSISLLRRAAQEQEPALSPEVRLNVIERAERNARRISSMLEELTETSQLESHRASFQLSECDLRQVVIGAIDSVDDTSARRITVETDGAASYTVLGDAPRLERVVANLLTNALKYSPNDAPVIARLLMANGSVVFETIDRGIGIAPESRDRLFEPYYRAPGGQARASGLGLGLYISRLIVGAHGGTISVSSEVESGSTFRMTLPARAS